MKFFVVDTNVADVANGHTRHASLDCVLACIKLLREIVCAEGVVLDDAMRILKEYQNRLGWSGQPGVGDAFFKWVWDHQAVEDRCEWVRIKPRSGAEDDFVEFPADPELKSFHRDDRKFVAVALASAHAPEILNAVDTDWWEHRDSLARHGVKVRFVCPDAMPPE